MVTWPEILPNPSTSFNLTAAPNASRTKMTSGYKRQRPMSSRTSYGASFMFELCDGGFELFKAFLDLHVENGLEWFECPIATGGGVVNRQIRIVDGKYKAVYQQHMMWKITFNADVKDIGIPGADFYDIVTSPMAPKAGWLPLIEALAICVNLGGGTVV